MVIFVVTGSVGEYSDRTEWVSIAFRLENDAKRRAESLTALWHATPRGQRVDAIREFDPNFPDGRGLDDPSYCYTACVLNGRRRPR